MLIGQGVGELAIGDWRLAIAGAALRRASSRRRRLVSVLIAVAVTFGPYDGVELSAQESNTQQTALPEPAPEVAVTDKGRVRLHVEGLPLADVLKLLSVQSRRNIIAAPDVQGSVTANLYDVTFEEALNAILVSNAATYRIEGNFIFVETLAKRTEREAVNGEKQVTKVFTLNYINSKDAVSYLSPILSAGGKKSEGAITPSTAAAAGLETGATNAGGDTPAGHDFIIVTAVPERLREIERVLAELDVRPQQVLIEATILRAELRDDNALGIDFSVVGGVDLQQLGGQSNAIQDLTLGQLPADRFELFNSAATTNFAKDVPNGGISIGIIKDHVAMFIRALEEVTDTTVLANPKVLALNKQKGQVIVGRRDGFLTTTVTETQAVQAVEFLETGTQLVFRPFISSDGWIRVELHPEDSVGFVNAQGLPSEQTTEVTTNVMVRDGETILIGGLFREVTTDARNQVPGLGSLPGIGQLFRSNSDSTTREEVIILMTLHVVKDQDAFANMSAAQREDIERMRVGRRRGLMWHGRERLAQAHYHRAIAAYEEGKTDRALWHLRLATHNNARMLPAIQLREKIEDERLWDDDGTGVRTFMQRLMGDSTSDSSPAFDRPAPTTRTPSASAGP